MYTQDRKNRKEASRSYAKNAQRSRDEEIEERLPRWVKLFNLVEQRAEALKKEQSKKVACAGKKKSLLSYKN